MLQEDARDPFLKYALSLEYSSDIQSVGVAIGLLEELKDAHPDYLPLYYQLAMLLKKTGKEEAAIAVAKRGQEIAMSQQNRHTFNELEGLIEDIG